MHVEQDRQAGTVRLHQPLMHLGQGSMACQTRTKQSHAATAVKQPYLCSAIWMIGGLVISPVRHVLHGQPDGMKSSQNNIRFALGTTPTPHMAKDQQGCFVF